jgi:hypothetical protein
MKRTLALSLIMAFALVCTLWIMPIRTVESQSFETIYIKADGSINPSTSAIQQSGNTYFLTADIAGNITVQKSNIVLDGKGYKVDSVAIGLDRTTSISNVTVKNFTIDGTSGLASSHSITSHFNNFGLLVFNGSNVLLTNNTIINTRHPGVYVSTVGINIVGGSSNKIIGNNLENNSDGLAFSHTQDNIITENNIIANHGWFMEFTWGIHFFDASNNVIFNNNFIDNRAQVGIEDSINMWDNGKVGNYWSDYDDIDADGNDVGDTPYVIDEKNQDNYPLVLPFEKDIPSSVEPTPTSPTPLPSEETQQLGQEAIIAIAVTIAVLGAGLGLLVYLIKRK